MKNQKSIIVAWRNKKLTREEQMKMRKEERLKRQSNPGVNDSYLSKKSKEWHNKPKKVKVNK